MEEYDYIQFLLEKYKKPMMKIIHSVYRGNRKNGVLVEDLAQDVMIKMIHFFRTTTPDPSKGDFINMVNFITHQKAVECVMKESQKIDRLKLPFVPPDEVYYNNTHWDIEFFTDLEIAFPDPKDFQIVIGIMDKEVPKKVYHSLDMKRDEYRARLKIIKPALCTFIEKYQEV